MPKTNELTLLRQMIERAQKQIDIARTMLEKLEAGEKIELPKPSRPVSPTLGEGGQIVEGVFDGINMIAGDGHSYTVPANYASKSKLVEGDILKLTISPDGTFVYKQIAPVERKRLRGTLLQDEDTSEYSVLSQGNTYRVLTASITYYKGEVGDEVIILVPTDKTARWAAVENIIKELAEKGADEEDEERPNLLDDATADLL